MAKELLISFIYDSQLCQKEEDDPQAAVVYFHPSWTSDDQKLALCGQLMGVTQFMGLNFEKPTIVSFSSGKFAVRYFKRYVLFVGSDQNLSDAILRTRAETLYQLIRFYHKDVCMINEIVSKQSGDNLTEKLAHIFQIYLPVLQYATNVFGNIPTFRLPKSADSIFLEAMQILRSFQENSGVLGGLILYQNRVICSQLSPDLTKLLVLTDPYRIKLPAENIPVKFSLPVGMQLLTVYVSSDQLVELKNETQSLLRAINELDSLREEMKTQVPMSNGKPTLAKEPTIGLKRDISRNFTLLEEDEDEDVRTELSINTSVPDIVKDVEKRSPSKISIFNNTAAANTVAEFSDSKLRSLSAESIPSSLSIPVRYYSLGLPPLDFHEKSKSKPPKVQSLLYNSICDPVFPYFKNNGLPASACIHDDRLTQHYSSLFQNSVVNTKVSKFLKKVPTIPEMPVSKVEIPKKEKPKRPMNLSLHSFIDNSETKSDIKNRMGNRVSAMPIPLTPLMAKLNALKQTQVTEKIDLDDLAEGDSPAVNTQLSIEEMLKELSLREKSKKEKKQQNKRSTTVNAAITAPKNTCQVQDEKLEELGLFVYGFQNTTLLLLLNLETSHDSVQVNSLFDRSVDALHKLESHLVHSLSTISQEDNSSNSYSFMALDPDWGTFYRGGSWVGESFELLSSIYNDMKEHPDFSEIVLRSDDSTVYGSQCGHSQIFYQQRSQDQNGGLPAPSDLMGTIHLKAKRRLERDHGFVLF